MVSVVGCAPPSTRRAIRSASASVSTASRKSSKPRRETLDTLEDVYTRSKRVFGPTHPFTQNARGKILDLS